MQNSKLKIPHFRGIWGNFEILSARKLSVGKLQLAVLLTFLADDAVMHSTGAGRDYGMKVE